MRRRGFFATIATTTVLLVTGCSGDSPEQPQAGPVGADFPVTVGDLTIEEQPTRIVVLSPAATEMVFAVGAGEQVVAVDEFSNYPPEAPTTELSGFDVSPEAVASYDPDLVVISSFAETVVPQLRELSIPVYVAADNPTSLENVYDQIVDLGILTGHRDTATDLVNQMSDEIAALIEAAPQRDDPLTYYIEIDDTYWTYTSDSLVGSLFAMIGLENIADEPGTVSIQLSAEALIAANPDIIFLANTAFGVDAEAVAQRDGWSSIDAVQQGRIVALDTDIASRWGPRIVELLATALDTVSQVP